MRHISWIERKSIIEWTAPEVFLVKIAAVLLIGSRSMTKWRPHLDVILWQRAWVGWTWMIGNCAILASPFQGF